MMHVHVDRCDSTQDILKEQLSLHPSEQILVSCESQTHGRGRGSHTWDDSLGTICFSMNITPHSKISFTAMEIALLVCKFFEETGHEIKLKWPNDLLTKQGLKCGGILVQGSGDIYLAGIGINLYSTRAEYGGVHDEEFFFDKGKWSLEIGQFILQNRYHSTNDLVREWQDRCIHLRKDVRIIDDRSEITGLFLGLGENGEALLETTTGSQRIFNGSLRII